MFAALLFGVVVGSPCVMNVNGVDVRDLFVEDADSDTQSASVHPNRQTIYVVFSVPHRIVTHPPKFALPHQTRYNPHIRFAATRRPAEPFN